MIDFDVKKYFPNFSLSAKMADSGIIAIIGKNGSGKTTLLKIIAGILKPDQGYIKVNDIDITNLPINKRGIVYVNQDTHIPNLKVKDHLLWGAKSKGIKVDEKELIEIAKELDIPINENKKVKHLSLGNRERVALGTALISRPKFILVDEAFSNINERKDFMKKFFELARNLGVEIIYTTQDVEDAKIGEKVYLMDMGILKQFNG